MASFQVTLWPEGDSVKVLKGEHKGKAGKVIGWSHIGPTQPDTIHHIVEADGNRIEVPSSCLG